MADAYQLLQTLYEQLPMMSEADQQFVVGCNATVNVTNAPLTAEQQQRLQKLAATMQAAEHNTLGLGAPLSIRQVFKDLESAKHMLTPAEHAFALKLSRQIAKGAQLDNPDLEKLLNIHAAKGF